MLEKINQNMRSYRSAWLLIFSNLFPIVGVLFFNFNIFYIFILYWVESGIVGFYGIIKMAFIKPENLGVRYQIQSSQLNAMKVFMIPFFLVHFSMFMFGHLTFILVFFAPSHSDIGFMLFDFSRIFPYFQFIWLGVVFLFISHGYSFYINFLGKKEYTRMKGQSMMFQPYKRIIIMQFTLIIGGFFYMAGGQQTALLILLIIFKILADLFTHMQERKKYAENI